MVENTTTFYMLMGIPASGKTTWSKYLNGTIVNSDVLRKEIFGEYGLMYTEEFIEDEMKNKDTSNLSDKELDLLKKKVASKKIFSLVDQKTIELLEKGISVIYDATNLQRKNRINILSKVRELNIHTVGIFMDTPIDVCIVRNSKREYPVPDEVIYSMYNHMNRPYTGEGFDELYRIFTK